MQSTDEKTKDKRRKHLKRILIAVLSAVLAVCTLIISFGQNIGAPSWNEVFTFFGVYADFGDDLAVSFLNAGSADACFITCHGKNVLIDAGLSANYDKLSAYIKRCGCTHFDAVIVSHPDSDHIGGMSGIIEDFGTDSLYMYSLPQELVPETEDYGNFVNSVKENNIELINPEIGSEISVGELKFMFISPEQPYEDINDCSLVVKMTFGENTFLFTGDISDEVEADLLNSNAELKSDGLKGANHGSKTSSSQEFLEAVSPQISVVSVGSNDSSLPDYYTMARINKFSGGLYRTDEDKTVVITSDGTNLDVQTHA